MSKNLTIALILFQLTLYAHASTNIATVDAADDGGSPRAFVNLGLLHTQDDFDRVYDQMTPASAPWKESWEKSIKNLHEAQSWAPCAKTAAGSTSLAAENNGIVYNDAATAYALALRWKGSNDDSYAARATAILDTWSANLIELGGSGEKFLSSSLYGYQFANAAEIMRDYRKWPANRQKRFQEMMVSVFYPMNHDFLARRNRFKAEHDRTHWELANMASMAAIGVLADRRDIYDEAIGFFKHGTDNKALERAKRAASSGHPLGQSQKSAQDQSHDALLNSLLSTFCQTAWKERNELFGGNDRLASKGVKSTPLDIDVSAAHPMTGRH